MCHLCTNNPQASYKTFCNTIDSVGLSRRAVWIGGGGRLKSRQTQPPSNRIIHEHQRLSLCMAVKCTLNGRFLSQASVAISVNRTALPFICSSDALSWDNSYSRTLAHQLIPKGPLTEFSSPAITAECAQTTPSTCSILNRTSNTFLLLILAMFLWFVSKNAVLQLNH